MEWITWWTLATVSLRVIMVWLYLHGGASVFAVALFHATSNLSWQLFPVHGSRYDPRIFGLVTLAFAIVMLGTDWLIRRGATGSDAGNRHR